MKRLEILWRALLIGAVALPCSLRAQADLFQHVYWEATGNHANQLFGYEGLDTLGRLNDTIPQALAISSDGGAALVLNRFPLDTTRRFRFPAAHNVRADFSTRSSVAYVSFDDNTNIFFLEGTSSADSPAVVLHLKGSDIEFTHTSIAVADVNRDGATDVVISDRNYRSGNVGVGRLLLFTGGTHLDSVPTSVAIGESRRSYVGGVVVVAHIHDTLTEGLLELRQYGDTVRILEYRYATDFQLVPFDTITCLLDSGSAYLGADLYTDPCLLTDVDGDGIDDILIGTPREVQVFKGGSSILDRPSYYFHRPTDLHLVGTVTFGTRMLDVGDISGHGYPSLLVTDPEADAAGGYFGGTVFVYNMGKALKDSCVAIASLNDYQTQLGKQAVALGDVNGDGLNDFVVASNDDDFTKFNVGRVTVFLGDSSYGPALSSIVHSPPPPLDLRLDQNYPNPFTDETEVTFAVPDRRLAGSEVTVKIYDPLGHEVRTLFRGRADGFGATLRCTLPALPSALYLCVLRCGGTQRTRTMIHIH